MIKDFMKSHEQLKDWQDKAIVFDKNGNQLEIEISDLLREYEEFRGEKVLEFDEQKGVDLTMNDAFYCFLKFEDNKPFSFFKVAGSEVSFSLRRPEGKKNTESDLSLIPLNKDEINMIQFTDEKNDKSFKMYSRLEEDLTSDEKDLIETYKEIKE